jgi:hypothetical protein
MASSLKTSWLKEEANRPLASFRKALQIELDKLEAPCKSKDIADGFERVFSDLKEYKDEVEIAMEEAANAVIWLEGQPTRPRLDTPLKQAVWGYSLLANQKMEQPQKEEVLLKGNNRLIDEKNLMGSLLLGTIQNPKTTIAWGKSGSWFYNDPVRNHVNIDPGQALILGLDNSRSILLHEIGHSQVTKGRSKKILELHDRLKQLVKVLPNGMRVVKKEDALDAAKLNRELSYRETFWQYCEDACVNTFAEIEGENFTNDIKRAMWRCYNVILLGRKAGEENSIQKAIAAATEEAKKASGASPKATPTSGPNPIEEEIHLILKAAGAAYPIQSGWMDKSDPSEWEYIGTKLSKETEKIVGELCDIKNDKAIGSLQPYVVAQRFELASPTILNRLTEELAEERNKKVDNLFDEFFLPLLEKLPDPPTPSESISIPGDGEGEGEPGNPGEGPKNPSSSQKSGKGDPSKDKSENKDKNSNGKDGEEKKEEPNEGQKDKDKDKGKGQGDKEKEENKDKGKGEDSSDALDRALNDQEVGENQSPEDFPVENPTSLEESRKKIEDKSAREIEDSRDRAKKAATFQKEGIKASMGSKSPLEELPTGCGNYAEAAAKCQEQIRYVTSILKRIALNQKVVKPSSLDILPAPGYGASSFQLDTYIERRKKEASGENIDVEDRKHFLAENDDEKKPATTHLAFYIDGSGSMSGKQAEKTMLTLVILNEASKKVKEIQVSAVYSGAGETQVLIDGGKVNKKHEDLISSILTTGYASGDNEICAQGLQEANECIRKTIPKSGVFGMTHMVFLTDGGSAGHKRGEISDSIKGILDSNPLSTFDTIIVDGSTKTNFHAAQGDVKTKRERQMPTITSCKNVSEICPSITHIYLKRIKQFKSFEPRSIEEAKRSIKKSENTLKKIDEKNHPTI